MYEVTISRHFDAAHFLRGYQGKCENLHGHRWQVEVTVVAPQTDEIGLAYDFRILKANLDSLLSKMDHTLLNEDNFFQKNNPSSENIARYLYDKLKILIREKHVRLARVKVYESPDAWVVYYE